MDCWDNPSSHVTNKEKKFSTATGQEIAYDNNTTATASIRALSPSPPSSATHQARSRGGVAVVGASAGGGTALAAREQSLRDKFPDLIDEKMSMSTLAVGVGRAAADFVSLPRPNRNQDHTYVKLPLISMYISSQTLDSAWNISVKHVVSGYTYTFSHDYEHTTLL